MSRAIIVVVAALAGSACLPSIEGYACIGDDECGAGMICVAKQCVARGAGDACSGGACVTDGGAADACSGGACGSDACSGGACATDGGPADACSGGACGADACSGSECAKDTGPKDTGPKDTGPTDTGPKDSGLSDIGPTDTGPKDSGLSDSGPADAVGPDTGPGDTGPLDGGCWALLFDGISSQGVAPSNPALDSAHTMTIEAWVNTDDATSDKTIVSRYSGTAEVFVFRILGRNLYACFSEPTTMSQSCAASSGTPVPLGQWTHVAVEFDTSSSTFRFYIAGLQITATPGVQITSILTGDYPVTLGAGAEPGGFVGLIGELRISRGIEYTSPTIDTTLPSVQLFQKTSNSAVVWHIDEGVGNVTYDIAGGNGIDANLMQTMWNYGGPPCR